MNDDFISRQAAIRSVCEKECRVLNPCNAECGSIIALRELPFIDVQPVVRCKDCKYFDSGTDEDGKPFFKCLGWVYGGTSEDDFCSFAERKDGEQDG